MPLYQNFISYLYEAQHVSGDTPPIIRSLKLHQQPLVVHTWRVVGHVVAGHCQCPATTRPTTNFLVCKSDYRIALLHGDHKLIVHSHTHTHTFCILQTCRVWMKEMGVVRGQKLQYEAVELQCCEKGTGVWGSHKSLTFADCCPKNVRHGHHMRM